MDSAPPPPDALRKKPKQVLKSETVSNTPPWLLLQFLPTDSYPDSPQQWTVIWKCQSNKSFPSQADYDMNVLPHNGKQTVAIYIVN